MKHLDFTEPLDSPQSTAGFLGTAMVPDSALTLGAVSGDGSYCLLGDAGTIARTSAGIFRGIA
jgi:hypothetical protein